jgi:hemolysin activation/secretion protein
MSFTSLHRSRIFAVSLVCLTVFNDGRSFAQSAPSQLPASADPGRISGQAPALPIQNKNLQVLRTQSQGTNGQDLVIPGSDQVLVDLKEIHFQGVSVYSSEYLQSLSSPFIGKKVRLKDIIDILNKLNTKYRNDGYIFARAFFPEQDITNGFVKIEVVEGYVSSVKIENPLYDNSEAANVILKRIQNLAPFNIHPFEQDVLMLNNLAGSTFKSVLKTPDQEKLPGALDVVLIESENPTTTTINFDNYGSQYSGPTEATIARTRYYNFLPYDQLDMQVFGTAPTDELRFVQLNYSTPFPDIPGLKLLGNASYGKTAAGSNLKELDVTGFSKELKSGASYTLPVNRASS